MLRATLPAPPTLISLRRAAITGAGASAKCEKLAVDEFVQHQVADAQHGLADNRLRQRVEIKHENLSLLHDQR